MVKKGRSVTLSAILVNAASPQIGGKAVALLRSYDGKTWKAVKSLASPDGRYSCRYKVKRKTSFRLWFGGDADWGQCTSRRVTVNVR